MPISTSGDHSIWSSCLWLSLWMTPFDHHAYICLGWSLHFTKIVCSSINWWSPSIIILISAAVNMLISAPLNNSILTTLFYWWSLIQFVHICCCDVFISAPIDNFNMLKPGSIDNSHSIFSYLVYVDVFISAPTDDFNMLIPVLLLISFNQYGHVCLGDVFISDPLNFIFLCHFYWWSLCLYLLLLITPFDQCSLVSRLHLIISPLLLLMTFIIQQSPISINDFIRAVYTTVPVDDFT